MAPRTCTYVSCESESTDVKQCAGCRKAWYCSQKCQTDDWVWHIFDCKLGKPISTIYYLARACYSDVVPVDAQTRIDYGFHTASEVLGGDAEGKLCGLYRGLLVHLDVPLKEVRKWQREGRLVEGIKSAYETLPPSNRGGYYPWFLQHQHLFDGSPLDEERVTQGVQARADKMVLDAWVFTGGSPNDSVDEIRAKISALSPERQACHTLYVHLVSHAHPSPNFTIWLSFGFVAAPDQGAEMDYGRKYQQLIHLCTFDEFCTAYESSSIPALFDRYGLSMHDSHLFRDVMSGSPNGYKSVWSLKQYVDELVSSLPDDHPKPARSVMADYGFMNCKDASDWKMLDELYTKLFTKHPRANPLELHEACIKGQLVEYAKRFVKLAPSTAKYTRLLKNLYPLRG